MTRVLGNLLLASALAVAASCASCTEETEDCPQGQERCQGFCVDPATYAEDEANCGGCGNACATGATCVTGSCLCPPGEEVCAGACVDPATYASDPANCGGCGIDCGVGTCAAGACDCGAFIACPAPHPRCVDGLTDARSCGTDAAACGNACPLANDVCIDGACTCPSGTTECPVADPTACVDLRADEANCGACGNPCAAGATCADGACLCPAGETACNDVCVNRQTDESNCGTCGWTCASGGTCTPGGCACPGEQPLTCGVPGTAGSSCCAGDGCCTGGACQTEHTNGIGVPGLGQHFYDCRPLGTYDVNQARAAAEAWQPAGASEPSTGLLCTSCFVWVKPAGATPAACGVWCYGDALRGRATLVQSLVCVCPTAGPPNWN